MVVARPGAGQRRHGRPQYRQRRPQACGRLRRRRFSEGRSRAGGHQRLHSTGQVQDAHDRRIRIEPDARARRKARATRARRRRQHLAPKRCRADDRRAARLRRLRLTRARTVVRRSLGSRPQRQDRRVPGRQPVEYSGTAPRALSVGRRAMGRAEARRRHRHDQHRQPEEHGHSVVAFNARAAAAVDGAGG